MERYEKMVAELPGMLGYNPDRARAILQRLLGEVRMVPKADGLYAEISAVPGRLLGLAGCDGSGGSLRAL